MAPPQLYFSGGAQPSLQDMRDRLRRNSFAHHQFNPKLESKQFREVFNTAGILNIRPRQFNPLYEQKTSVLDLLVKGHERKAQLEA
jgi:hypothetical protein